MTVKHYLNVDEFHDVMAHDPFIVDESESLEDIWERLQLILAPSLESGIPVVFEERKVTKDSDAITLDQLLLNGAIGGRRLRKILCMILTEDGEPLEFISYKVNDFKYRRMVPL